MKYKGQKNLRIKGEKLKDKDSLRISVEANMICTFCNDLTLDLNISDEDHSLVVHFI